MTRETAIILAQAIDMRDVAADGLKKLVNTNVHHGEIPPPVAESMRVLAATYVHEQRIINDIIAKDRDE